MNFDHSSKDKDFRCDATWSFAALQRHRSRRKSGRDRGESGSRMDNRPGPLLTLSVISPPSIDALRKAHLRLLPCNAGSITEATYGLLPVIDIPRSNPRPATISVD
jgi:hypothetical protein